MRNIVALLFQMYFYPMKDRWLCAVIISFGAAGFLTRCSNPLEEKEQTIRVYYMSYACECAQWMDMRLIEKYNGNLPDDSAMFIEPAHDSLKLHDSLNCCSTVIELTGRFHEKAGFPEGYSSEQHPDKASVFRYSNYHVIGRLRPN
jgi:hypothetical protein